MIAASVFGIFLIPMLYVVFQSLREGRLPRLFTRDDASTEIASEPSPTD